MKDIHKLIKILTDEIVHVHSIHASFKKLYRKDDETRELLSDSDQPFFTDLYIVYLSYISVGVSRLLDPHKSVGKQNLSVFTLFAVLKDNEVTIPDDLNRRLSECKSKAYNFTDPRNQLVAHLDYETNFSSLGRSIPSFITKEFDEFYNEIGMIMNEIRSLVGMDPFMFEWGIFSHGYGQKLLSRLRAGQKYFEPDDADNPCNPHRNSKNQPDD